MDYQAEVQLPAPPLREEAARSATSFFAPLYGSLRGYALRLERSEQDAEDLLHDTLERALRNLDGLDHDSNRGAWMSTIMRNLFVDRRRLMRRTANSRELRNVDVEAPKHEAPKFWEMLGNRELEAALSNVDGPLRRPFMLRWQNGCSYREIAEELRIPRNTVGTQLMRARQQLRRVLSKNLPMEATDP